MLNSEVWHRRILNVYWTLAGIILAGQILSVRLQLKLAHEFAVSDTNRTLVFICYFIVLICLIAGEVWQRAKLKYQQQAVVVCGFIVSYLLYFIAEPFVDGAQMSLMMPLMASLIYFNRRLLFIIGGLNSLIYAAIYFTLERIHLGKPLLDFLLMEVIFGGFVVMGLGIIVRAHETSEHLEQLTQSEQGLLVDRAIADKLLKIDALTGLYNHKTFHEYLDSLLEQCETNGLRLQLALLDIDNFKQVNDTYGHWIGDIVLKEVAAKISEKIGLNDFAARYGGEEFAIIFTDRSPAEAFALVEELRLAIASMEHHYAGDKPITISIGLCSYFTRGGKELLFRKTDDALYLAKRSGKNQVIICEEKKPA
ncbi:Response regulator PleD [compost metagenome]